MPMTGVIEARPPGSGSASVSGVDATATTAEERKVGAARRFGRIGLAITVGWLLLVPAFVLWTGVQRPGLVPALVVLYVAAVGLHLWRIREHVTSLGRPARPWFVVAASGVAVALTLTGLASGWSGYIWAVVGGVLLGDVVGGLRARWVAVWIAVGTAVVLTAGYAAAASATVLEIPISPWLPAGLAAWFVATMWTLDVERLWWLKAVTDLDDSRRTAAELATARERLRLADDLHDILGHALEVVAFKSELAARLQHTDPGRARAEMDEVQRVARSSMDEVRALVRDTRGTDLAAELAGARAVLGPAGVALTVVGDPDELTSAARRVLGRVLREAMTNVLRHAEPHRCSIVIAVDDGAAELRVDNDGALPSTDTGDGTGLAALSRHLQEHAGRLDAGPGPDGTYRLTARLPGATVRALPR